ncbi:MAG: serine hydrolase [Deltaproteobacteria bacterium]|nr:serine hydrolase [Deltaproteobacteria bacterium]MBW2543805.1 serine hydrolase [Deltaproteobacteria bacterium]
MAPWWLVALLALALPSVSSADDLGDLGDDYWEVIETTSIKELMALDGIARFEDNAPLWDYEDAELQKRVEQALVDLGLDDKARKKQLSVALVDLSLPGPPRVAAINGDEMMYAASLPKIAVLLAAFEKIAQGKMTLDEETEARLTRMIKVSSNRDATAMMHKVGKEYIARVLLSPRYRLYDPEHNGGLWVGKDYAKAGLWRRDPLHNLSHGATAMQVARFYYLLATDNLVTPEHSRKMREILGGSELNHKFVRALRMIDPRAAVSRKSGSWSTYHSDSVLVERDGRRYIAVALANNPTKTRWLGRIITKLDALLIPEETRADQRPLSANQAAR